MFVKRTIAAFLGILTLASSICVSNAATSTRIQGSDRYVTSAEVARSSTNISKE